MKKKAKSIPLSRLITLMLLSGFVLAVLVACGSAPSAGGGCC